MSKKIPLLCSLALCGWFVFIAGLQFSDSPAPFADKPDATATNTYSDPIGNWREVSSKWSDWTDDYQATAEAEKQDDLIAQGIALARERRAAMFELIQSDPQAALEAAVSRIERARLPREIQEQLETIISVRAPLDLMATCFHPDQPDHCTHDHLEHHSTFFDGQAYRVHVYGSRLHDLSIPHTSMHGIAIDNHLALSESRVRVLDADESRLAGIALPAPDAVAVEANGEVTVLQSIAALPEFEAAILNGEDNPTYIASDAGDGTSTIGARPNEAHAAGNKKFLLILVDYSDLPGRPLNRSSGSAPLSETMASDLIHGTNGVRDFFVQNSFGKTDIIMAPAVNDDSPDITEVLRMPETASYYSNTGGSTALQPHAWDAAAAAGYNIDDYDRIGVFTTYLANFDGGILFNGWGGRAAVGGKGSVYNGFWDFRVVAHELGHNWGLRHSNLWKVTDGNPGSLAGTSQEYGDEFDTMGAAAGSHLKHFSHWNKSLLWWIPDAAIPAAQSSGIYRVHRFDHGNANLALSRGLKIVRDETRDYWIGYRRAQTVTSFYNGAYVLWGYNWGRKQGDLLDMNTPGSNLADAALAMNQTYTDLAGGIEFTPVAQGGSGGDEWIDIQVEFFDAQFVEFNSPEFSVNYSEGFANLLVVRGEIPSGSASVNYSTSSGTAIAPDDFTSTSGTLTWADGDTAPKTIAIPINPVGVGDESGKTFTVSLSSPVGAGLGTIANTTVTITYFQPPVVHAGPDQALIFEESPWSPLALDSSIAWYDASDLTTITHADGAVSELADKIGTNPMVQATSGKQPMSGIAGNQINGLNSIAFDGIDDVLKTDTNPFGPSISNAMLMGVFNIGTISNSTLFSLSSSNTTRWQSHAPFGNGILYFDCGGTSGTNRISKASGFAAYENRLLGYYCSTTDDVQQVWVDGANFVSDDSGHSVATAGGIALGHDGATSVGFDNCRIGEVVIINGTVSASNREKLEGYLAHKWGLAANLPASHPYKNATPAPVGTISRLEGTVSLSPGDSVTTTWSVLSGPDGGAHIATPFSLTSGITFSVPGIYVLRLTVSNSFRTVTSDVTYAIETSSIYHHWGDVHGLTGVHRDPSAILQGDGLANLLKFAFGMNPAISQSQRLNFDMNGDVTQAGVPMLMNFAAANASPDYRAVFLRRKDHLAAGLVYTVDFSADLAQWTTSVATPTLLTDPGGSGDLQAVSVPYPAMVPANGDDDLPPRFFRVGVDMP